jgi:hypothetical protein
MAHEVHHRTDDGWSAGMLAGILFAVLIAGGVLFYALYDRSDTRTASSPPAIERTAPPQTTGQGTRDVTPAPKAAPKSEPPGGAAK